MVDAWETIESVALTEAMERLRDSISIRIAPAGITDVTFSTEVKGAEARLYIVSEQALVREIGAPGLPPQPIIAGCISVQAEELASGIAAVLAARAEELFA